MGRPHPPLEPLAALTRLDALGERLPGGDSAVPGGVWRAEAPVAGAALWVYYHLDVGCSLYRWALVREDSIEIRLPRLIKGLTALADTTHSVRSLPEPSESRAADLCRRARTHLDERRERLEAVRLAPLPLRTDSPQRELWRKIRTVADRRPLPLDRDRLTRLRRRLLRPYPRGIERQLSDIERSVSDPPSGAASGETACPARNVVELVRRLESITDRLPRRDAPVEVDFVSGLYLAS